MKTTTLYEYGLGTPLDPDDCLRRTITYEDDTIRTTKPVLSDDAMRSITTFVGIIKGSEVADFTVDYATGKTTFYFYGNTEETDGVRAVSAGSEDQMV